MPDLPGKHHLEWAVEDPEDAPVRQEEIAGQIAAEVDALLAAISTEWQEAGR